MVVAQNPLKPQFSELVRNIFERIRIFYHVVKKVTRLESHFFLTLMVNLHDFFLIPSLKKIKL